MKKIFCLLSVICAFFIAEAQTFVGTMTVENYTRKNVEAFLTTKNNITTLFLYDVKFSRFMPVKVDVAISKLKLNKQNNRTTISGNNIIPTVKGKGYNKYKITNFSGSVNKESLTFSTMMGNKRVSYNGKIKK